MTQQTEDHLFINYASEDSDFAEWLALRLTAEGYSVWFDKMRLLGGESYPSDIDKAIKERTFRMLSIMSESSVQKPNPLKERTIALNIGRAREIDFLIPLNLGDLSSSQLHWTVSDLTFIPFHSSWAAGFGQLLKKLEAIGAPRDLAAGQATACNWLAAQAKPESRPEKLVSNVLPVLELPRILLQFEVKMGSLSSDCERDWPYFQQRNSKTVFAFNPPPQELELSVRCVDSIPWFAVPQIAGLTSANIALTILRKAMIVECRRRGLQIDEESRSCFFPDGLLRQNSIRFMGYDGRKTHIQVIGERRGKCGGITEIVKYHLAPVFRLSLTEYPIPTVRVSLRLHLTDLRGNPLDGKKITSRRKRICRSWWNHQWFCRFLSVVDWLCEGKPECDILHTADGSFRIGSTPLTLHVDQGIDELQGQIPAQGPDNPFDGEDSENAESAVPAWDEETEFEDE
ncbi:MAG: toll/interleukin-1 receptor domain-containing protein [Candidatus Brocadiia bacterium]